MVTPGRERIRKLRGKREGQTPSVWLYGEETRMFENIRILTNDTKDAIVNRLIREAYESIFNTRCYKVISVDPLIGRF